MIFELVLVTNDPIEFVESQFKSRRPPEEQAILRTSKQFYREAGAVFLSQNKFAMNRTDLEQFLLPRSNHVRSISINLDRYTLISTVLSDIKKCEDLRSLHINLKTRPCFLRTSEHRGEEYMRSPFNKSWMFKRPKKLEQVSFGVPPLANLENLELFCGILPILMQQLFPRRRILMFYASHKGRSSG